MGNILSRCSCELNHTALTLRKMAKETSNLDVEMPSSGLETKQHALRTEVVVREIFNHLPIRDLKACRLVCPLWNDISTTMLTKMCDRVTIEGTEFGACGRFRVRFRISEFIDCAKRSPKPPFSKIEISSTGSEDVISLANIFHDIAGFADDLVLTELAPAVEGFKGVHILLEWLSFPLLKTLSLELPYMSRGEGKEDFMNLAAIIVGNAPALERVEIRCKTTTDMSLFLKAFQKANNSNVSCLVLCGPMHDDHISKLVEMNVRLKYLRLRFHSMGTNPAKFLETQSSTLQGLEVATDKTFTTNNKFQVTFPPMIKLENLTVDMSGQSEERIVMTFPKLSYVCQFSTLKSLSILMPRDGRGTAEDFIPGNMKTSRTVTELRFPGVSVGGGNGAGLARFAKIFPNVIKLEVPASWKNVITIASHSWPQLEELTLNTVDDIRINCIDILTSGVNLMRFLPYDYLTNPDYRGLVDRCKERNRANSSSIDCLEALKTLRIKPYLPGFTETSCRLLLQMKSLTLLDLRRAEEDRRVPHLQVARELLAVMKGKFNVFY